MDLRIFSSPEEVARAAAQHFVSLNPQFVALSGGSTPRVLYELLADPREPFREQIAWGKTHFFFTDERHVPPDHPESNYRMANEALFSRVPLPVANIHRIPGERTPAEAADDYEHELQKSFGEAVPAFDVILLGLGDDGHTASLFPDSAALKETEHLVAAPWVEKLNAYRITLTLPVLNEGKSVLFLVTGTSKAEILGEIINADKRKTRLFPAQTICPTSGEVSWFVDEAAARLCSRSNSSNTGAGSDLLNRKP
jgi:6-phosphogluconolactonase